MSGWDSRKQDAIDVKQRLHPARRFLEKQLPLCFRKPEVVMRVMLGNAAARMILQFRVLRRGVNDERREKLFQNVAVLLEQ